MSRIERVESSDGTAVACHVAGKGPPLVLVHGTSADHTRWAPVITALSADFTTYAMDRRGRGASADAEEYSIELEFDDVTAVIDAIGGDVDVLGHSYGGVCSLEATLRTPRVRRLVLYEPPLPIGIEIYPPGLIERLGQLLAAGDREGVVATFFREVVRMPAAELDIVRADPSWEARVAAAHTIPRELRIADTYRPDFGRIATVRAPTLLLLGGDSPPFLAGASPSPARIHLRVEADDNARPAAHRNDHGTRPVPGARHRRSPLTGCPSAILTALEPHPPRMAVAKGGEHRLG